MVWREGKDHTTHCYFSIINLKRINHSNKHYFQYAEVPSFISVIPPVPKPDSNMEYSSDSEHNDMNVVAGDDPYKPEDYDQLVLLIQELNDLIRDLNLSKETVQLLGSRLKKIYTKSIR